MYQDPRFYAQELSKAARHELDRAVERLMKRWFQPGVGSEIAVAVIMKACAERLSESEDGQDRLIRHLKGWADTVTRNEAWMRAHRARSGNADAPLPPGVDLRPTQSPVPDAMQAPSRYRPQSATQDSPPPGTMRERWAARDAARGRKTALTPAPAPAPASVPAKPLASGGGGAQPTEEEIELLRQAAAIAGNEAMGEPPAARPLRPTQSRSQQGDRGGVDPPWAQGNMPTDAHWAEQAADTGIGQPQSGREGSFPIARADRPASSPGTARPDANQGGARTQPARPTGTRPGPDSLADFLSRL